LPAIAKCTGLDVIRDNFLATVRVAGRVAAGKDQQDGRSRGQPPGSLRELAGRLGPV
jgi:hypothetical protein